MNSTEISRNKVFVNMTALRHNFREVKNLAGERRIMAMVKSDAYGHGLVACALTLEQAGADALGVMDLGEGLALRQGGLNLPVHVLGGVNDPEHVDLALENDIAVFAESPELVRMISDRARALKVRAKIHLAVDTAQDSPRLSMGQAGELIREMGTWPNLKILGLATRLASVGDAKALRQLEKFDKLCYKIKNMGFSGGLDTCLDSCGLIWHNDNRAPLVRAGILLYGVHPGTDFAALRPDLRPVMTVLSKITSIKDLKAGDQAGRTPVFLAPRPMRVAVTPFGFSSGLIRTRTSPGWVLIRGRKAPLLGRASMHSSSFDVTGIEEAAVGDIVVIVGRHGTSEIKAGEAAAWCDAAPSEILTLFGKLNPRFAEGSDI
ncbi:MAG: alanine racemase [Candidatus Adiutrix sp.]|jgi:alanine racemase|nr:alanine racemase [Candidatus Adiutrix sp.]